MARTPREHWLIIGLAAYGGYWVTIAVSRLWPHPEPRSWSWAALALFLAVAFIRESARRLRTLTSNTSN